MNEENYVKATTYLGRLSKNSVLQNPGFSVLCPGWYIMIDDDKKIKETFSSLFFYRRQRSKVIFRVTRKPCSCRGLPTTPPAPDGCKLKGRLQACTPPPDGRFRFGLFEFVTSLISFKGSQVDRKFSFGNLKKEFELKSLEQELKTKQTVEQAIQEKQEAQKNSPSPKRILVILGVKLNAEQEDILKNGGYLYLENMNRNDNNGEFSSYVFMNDDRNRVCISKNNPDDFIKHGKYEMRIRDKILVDNGYVTRAKVKWWGGGSYAYPYLWKNNKSDLDYQESWSDPRSQKTQKTEQKPRKPIVKKINRGRKR